MGTVYLTYIYELLDLRLVFRYRNINFRNFRHGQIFTFKIAKVIISTAILTLNAKGEEKLG